MPITPSPLFPPLATCRSGRSPRLSPVRPAAPRPRARVRFSRRLAGGRSRAPGTHPAAPFIEPPSPRGAMPGLYCPSSWTPLPLTDSWVRACANGPCLSLRARLTYHNPQPQPVEGEARAGRGAAGSVGPARSDAACAPSPQACSCTRWRRPKWSRASRRRLPDGASRSSCRAGDARKPRAAALWAPGGGPPRPAAARRVSVGRRAPPPHPRKPAVLAFQPPLCVPPPPAPPPAAGFFIH